MQKRKYDKRDVARRRYIQAVKRLEKTHWQTGLYATFLEWLVDAYLKYPDDVFLPPLRAWWEWQPHDCPSFNVEVRSIALRPINVPYGRPADWLRTVRRMEEDRQEIC